MDIANFFYTYPGMYATQSFLHALVATILVDMAIEAWKIDNPLARQRFRFTVILYAILSFPVYQIINPERGSVLFRGNAVFDSNQWLSMELFGILPLRWFFVALMSITALVFFFQELVPVLAHSLEKNEADFDEGSPEDEALVDDALEPLPGPKPSVVILDDDDLVLFSSSGRKPSVFISTGLLRSLPREQVQAALAHEAAHMDRNRRPVLVLVFLLRAILFFNPVVLVEFRRAVRNEEKICDDIAVSLTGKPLALADALKKFYSHNDSAAPDEERKPSRLLISLEEYGHNLQLAGRIARLEEGLAEKRDAAWFPYVLIFLIASMLNYFIV